MLKKILLITLLTLGFTYAKYSGTKVYLNDVCLLTYTKDKPTYFSNCINNKLENMTLEYANAYGWRITSIINFKPNEYLLLVTMECDTFNSKCKVSTNK